MHILTHIHTHTQSASTQVTVCCLLKANPLKWTECELTASSERLTSATFLTSYYWGYPATTLPLGHWSYAHTITNSHTGYKHTLAYKAKGTGTNTKKMHTETLIWACGIVTILPGIPTTVCQRRLQLEGHYGWRERDAEGERRAESQMRRVTWSNREDLRLIRFHIGSMVLWLQNARYGSEISLRL